MLFRATLAIVALLLGSCADDGPSDGGTGGGIGGAASDGGAAPGGAPAGGATSGGGPPEGGSTALFSPTPGTTWQWQLDQLPLDTSFDVQVYDIDLFDIEASEIAALQAEGRDVICYFNAGTWEPWRPDADDFPDDVKGNPFDDPAFSEELYLDIRAPIVQEIMQTRLDLAMTKGCDAVEPDVVNLHEEGEAIVGFDITYDDQLQYNLFLAEEAHARGLSVGLKNDLSQLQDLEPFFDWALNESCWTYDECDAYADNFLANGKAVFHAEYVEQSELDAVCAVTTPLGLSTILKEYELGPWMVACSN